MVFTLDDLDKAMKAVGRNVALANAAIVSRDFEGAKVRVARAREQLSPTVSFWTNEKKADAVKLVRAATARLDALDRALSANPVERVLSPLRPWSSTLPVRPAMRFTVSKTPPRRRSD